MKNLKDYQQLNNYYEGSSEFLIEFTPKGSTEKINLLVNAKNKLDASNFLILNKIYGTQHSVTLYNSHIEC